MGNFFKRFLSAVIAAAVIISCIPTAAVFAGEADSAYTSQEMSTVFVSGIGVSMDKIGISSGSTQTSDPEIESGDSSTADDTDSTDAEENASRIQEPVNIISASSDSVAWPKAPEIESESAIVIEADSGLVLYEKNADEQQYPASITKIMTTLLALENSSLDETVTFSETAVYENEGSSSNIARDLGEEMTMEQTLYGVMLESANECAWAVAEHVGGGDVRSFIDMMNERAAALGCTNTHFNNPNGLPDEDHYTSCRDMALISQEAIKNTMFRKIISTVTYTIPPTNKHSEETNLNNHHRMINPYKGDEYLYEYAIGGKTGYTEAAQNTLVTYAEKDGMLLICVVMKTMSPYDDTRALFDFCFDNFSYYNIFENEARISDETGFAKPDTDAAVILPEGADFNDTAVTVSYENASDSVLGTLIYSYGGRQVGSMDIMVSGLQADTASFDNVYATAKDDPNVSAVNIFLERAGTAVSKALAGEWTLRMIAVTVTVGAVVVILIVLLVISRHRRRAERRLRNKRYKTIKQYRRKKRRRNRRW